MQKDTPLKLKSEPWYRQPDMTIAKALTFLGTSSLMFFMLYASPFGSFFDQVITRTLDFRTRLRIGAEPSIDSRIKVFLLDDRTVQSMQKAEFTLAEYAQWIEALAPAKPSIVLIDKIFALVPKEENAATFVKRVKASGVNVVAGSFLVSKEQKRKQADLERKEFQLRTYDPESSSKNTVPPKRKQFIYGPNKAIEKAFFRLGNVTYDGLSMVKPAVRFQEGKVLMHWGLLPANKLAFDNGALKVGGHRVHENEAGLITVNLLSMKSLLKKSSSFLELQKAIKEKKVSDLVKENDVVFFLPQAFTGNTDFKETQLGQMYGGYINVAVANSALSGKWLKPLPAPTLILFALGFFGVMLGYFVNSLGFLMTSVLISMGIVGGGLLGFAWFGITSPWLFGLLQFNLSGFALFVERLRLKERRTVGLKRALSGVIPNHKIETLLKNIDHVRLEASEQVLSVMFLDLVGFSEVAETGTPGEVFQNLKEVMNDISKTVHAHDGVVDRVLGDGMLAYFGYSFDGQNRKSTHADQALKCAVAIQHLIMSRILKEGESAKFLNLLRIGINTGAAYVGDLGGDHKLDFTLVGNAVNFAKRLESACDPFRILIGATTRDSLSSIASKDMSLMRRSIAIKNHEELSEVYEYNPFANQGDNVRYAMNLYRKRHLIDRIDERFPIEDTSLFTLKTNVSDAHLVDFAKGGLGIELTKYLGRAVTVSLAIDTSDQLLNARLRNAGMGTILCEVKWARQAKEGWFFHGLSYKNLSAEQCDWLLTELRMINSGMTNVVSLKAS